MENAIQTQVLRLAAGTAGRISFLPNLGGTWRLSRLALCPNATTAADGTNYLSYQAFVGATAVTAATSTASVALTAGTPVEVALTGSAAQREATFSAPLSVRVSHAGSGAAIDASVIAEFERVV